MNEKQKHGNKKNFHHIRGSLPKTGPLPFGSENQFPLNFGPVLGRLTHNISNLFIPYVVSSLPDS